MYQFINATWNTIKGECPHGCSYCYMHRWGKQKPVHFDKKELKTDLGSGNFIFVGSSCDMFAEDIPAEWVIKTLEHCYKFDNTYLFQSKNPRGIHQLGVHLPKNVLICTTIESNRFYTDLVNSCCPSPQQRAKEMSVFSKFGIKTYVTIEPIMDFDLPEMINLIEMCTPEKVNIGADSGNNHLPEPSKEKLIALIDELKKFTTIANKRNLNRILNS